MGKRLIALGVMAFLTATGFFFNDPYRVLRSPERPKYAFLNDTELAEFGRSATDKAPHASLYQAYMTRRPLQQVVKQVELELKMSGRKSAVSDDYWFDLTPAKTIMVTPAYGNPKVTQIWFIENGHNLAFVDRADLLRRRASEFVQSIL